MPDQGFATTSRHPARVVGFRARRTGSLLKPLCSSRWLGPDPETHRYAAVIALRQHRGIDQHRWRALNFVLLFVVFLNTRRWQTECASQTGPGWHWPVVWPPTT
jgi:hypothetical protein